MMDIWQILMIIIGVAVASAGNQLQLMAQWRLDPDTNDVADLDKKEYEYYYSKEARNSYERIGSIVLVSGLLFIPVSILMYLYIK